MLRVIIGLWALIVARVQPGVSVTPTSHSRPQHCKETGPNYQAKVSSALRQDPRVSDSHRALNCRAEGLLSAWGVGCRF